MKGDMRMPVNVYPPNVLPPIVYPTQQFVNENQFTNIVPHIHPSHTTTINETMYQHLHYFPHTHSVVNEVCHQHFCCEGPVPFPY